MLFTSSVSPFGVMLALAIPWLSLGKPQTGTLYSHYIHMPHTATWVSQHYSALRFYRGFIQKIIVLTGHSTHL